VGSDDYWGVLPPQTIRRAVLSENNTGLRRSSTTFTLCAIEDGPQLTTQSSIEDHGKIDARPPCIIGRLSNSVAALRCIAFSLRVNKAPLKGCLGRWVPVSTASRLCGGYSPRIVWNPGEEVGCDFELRQAVAYQGSTQPQTREGGLSGKFSRQSATYATGSTRYSILPQSPL
jgi:hypothetical protein